MRSDWRDFNPMFLTAGMVRLPATITTTMRTSQTRRFEGAAVVIGIPPSRKTELQEKLDFDAATLTNIPEIYMKACQIGPSFRALVHLFFLMTILIGGMQASDPAKHTDFSWRWRLAGGFIVLPTAQKRRPDAGATSSLQTIPLRSSSSG
jgi:hypothetical protein